MYRMRDSFIGIFIFFERLVIMNRTVKNVSMIVVAVLLAAAMVFTVNTAAKSSPMASGMPSQQMQQGQQGQPPEMPGGNDESNSDQGGAPDQQQGQQGQQGQPPQMPGNMSGAPGGSSPAHIDGKFYALFGAEALAFALILLYLILSKGNLRTARQVFRGKYKIAAFALAAILAAGCLTQAEAGLSRYIQVHNGKCQQIEMDHGSGGKQNGAPDQQDQNGGPGGQDQSGIQATGATTVDGTEKTLNDSYSSTEADQNAILVTGGGTLTSDGATIDKKSGDSSSTESSDFSGVNAALLVNDDSTATVKNARITTSAKGANAIFATGEKSKVNISDSTIATTGEASSRGLDATYGGTIEANNVKISTQGGSCAAMATDRGEGTVTATRSTLETNGAGSPIIYSTGNITLKNSTGNAKGAQITVVEGKNSATIENSKLTCSAAGNRGDVDVAGVMVYQSMSGDAGEGTGNFTATGSTLSIDKGSKYYKTAPMFFVTNTDAVIKLTDTKLDFGSGTLLSAKGTTEWGQQGSNGGTVSLQASRQKLTGNVELDKISTLEMDLSSNSTFTGTINGDDSAKSVKLTIDKTSKIKLTGDTYVSSLKDEDGTYSNIDFNGYKLYVDGKAIG